MNKKHTPDELNTMSREELVTIILAMQGQLDALYNASVSEPEADDVIQPKPKEKKTKEQRETDLKDFPQEIIPAHTVSADVLDSFYGKGCWRQLPSETYKRLRHEPESWTVEIRTVSVFVGTDGDHQDEFLRGDRPRDLFRNSIATPGLHPEREICQFRSP